MIPVIAFMSESISARKHKSYYSLINHKLHIPTPSRDKSMFTSQGANSLSQFLISKLVNHLYQQSVQMLISKGQ